MKANKLIRQICFVFSSIVLCRKWVLIGAAMAAAAAASSSASSRSTTYRPNNLAQYITSAGPAEWSTTTTTTTFQLNQPLDTGDNSNVKFNSKDKNSRPTQPNQIHLYPHLNLHKLHRPHPDSHQSNSAQSEISPLSHKLIVTSQLVRPTIAIETIRIRLKRTKNPFPVEINRCSWQTFEDCLSMMQELMQNSSLAYPTDNQGLDLVCRKLKEGDHCAEQYIRSCAGNQLRLLYQDIVKGAKNVIRLLCQHGEPRQLYLQFSSCYKDVHNLDRCSTELQAISNAMETDVIGNNGMVGKVAGNKNDDKKLQQFCCAYKDSFECQLSYIQQYCGDKGMEYFKRYLGEMTNTLINEHCISYTYSNKCKPYRQRTTSQQTGNQQNLEEGDIEESWENGEETTRLQTLPKDGNNGSSKQKPRSMATSSATSTISRNSNIFWIVETIQVLRITALLTISIRITVI